ncbi:MAG: DUF481 domain-containing protein, partial [Woeseiaceae bacterium]
MKFLLYLLLAFSVLSGQLMADELQLTNGDSLNGELVRTDGKQVVWKSPVLGTLKVPKKHVVSVNGEPLPAVPEKSTTRRKFTGRISFGIELDRGNSDNDEYDLDIKTSLKSGRYTHNLTAEYEFEQRRDITREEDHKLKYQVDRSFKAEGGGWYLYGLTEWNKDRFREPEEWTAIGGGAGYLWRPTTGTEIKTQLGADSWELSRLSGDKETETGGRWVLDIQHKFKWLADISVFHNLQLLWVINNTSNRILESTTG